MREGGSDVKELIPGMNNLCFPPFFMQNDALTAGAEFFYFPEMFENIADLHFGRASRSFPSTRWWPQPVTLCVSGGMNG